MRLPDQPPKVSVGTFRERIRGLGMEDWYDSQPLPVRLAKRGQTSDMVTVWICDGKSQMPQVAPHPLAWSVN